jgi:hypothetical protein
VNYFTATSFRGILQIGYGSEFIIPLNVMRLGSCEKLGGKKSFQSMKAVHVA